MFTCHIYSLHCVVVCLFSSWQQSSSVIYYRLNTLRNILCLVGDSSLYNSLCVCVCWAKYLVILLSSPGSEVTAFLSVCVSQWIWVKIKPSHVSNVMCVNKYLTGDATIMRRSHEVDGMKAKKEEKSDFLPVITAYFARELSWWNFSCKTCSTVTACHNFLFTLQMESLSRKLLYEFAQWQSTHIHTPVETHTPMNPMRMIS